MENQIQRLTKVTSLFRESFKLFRANIKILIGIMAIPVGFRLIGWGLELGLKDFYLGLFWGFWSLISGFLFLLAVPTLIYALKEKTGIITSFQKALSIFLPYIWVFVLVNLIVAGGFLLLVIPGILFLVWFWLSFYPLIFEEKRGMLALFESRELVSGRFWQVLWRFLALGIVIIAISMPFLGPLAFFQMENTEMIISHFLQLFIMPFSIVYGFLIYQNLRELKKEIPSPAPLLKRKLKYLIPGTLGLLICIPNFTLILLYMFLSGDVPPPNDNDLQLQKVTIPKEQNAYYDLEKIKPKIESISDWLVIDDHLERKTWDKNFVSQILANNSEVLTAMAAAAQRPHYQDPATDDPAEFSYDMALPSLRYTREAAELNILYALALAKDGDFEESIEELFNVLEVAQKMQNSQGTMMHYLVAVAMKETALENIREIITQADFSTKELIQYVKQLEKFKENEEGLKTIWKAEYLMQARAIDNLVRGSFPEGAPMYYNKLLFDEPGKNFYFKPNKMKHYFAQYARTNVENSEKPCAFMEELGGEKLIPELAYEHPQLFVFVENAVGKILLDISAVSLSNIHTKRCLENFSVSGTQLLLALKAYKQENGDYPATLEGLVPQYIAKVPQDPFDGKHIRYSKEKRIIYSVGEDLADSGGSEGDDWKTMKDPTFQIGPLE